MKRKLTAISLAACLLLSGCASLLERSYSQMEPYADRYWDASAEDTLRAENYQDLVNSLLLLVEQRSEEGVIRYYTDQSAYRQAMEATREVEEETMLGSYLLEDIDFTYKASKTFGTFTYRMTYREDAEDVDALMVLSDTQSLVDLLRLAVREGHDKLTARFAYDMPREDVEAAVESMWRGVCAGEDGVPGESGATGGETPAAGDPVPEEPSGEQPAEEAPKPAEGLQEPEASGEEAQETAVETGAEIPPCPWTVRFYPDLEAAELVEVLLQP